MARLCARPTSSRGWAATSSRCCSPDESDPGNVANLASRLIEQICMPFSIDGQELSIGLSLGIAIAPINGTQADQLVRNADLALYRAKAEGGDCYCFFETRMDAEVHERRELEIELNEALERNEFVLHYQPVIAAADGTLSGLEALIRWNHPTRGLVPPIEFMPLAERTGLIARIGEWTILEACRALAQLPEHLTRRHQRFDQAFSQRRCRRGRRTGAQGQQMSRLIGSNWRSPRAF